MVLQYLYYGGQFLGAFSSQTALVKMVDTLYEKYNISLSLVSVSSGDVDSVVGHLPTIDLADCPSKIYDKDLQNLLDDVTDFEGDFDDDCDCDECCNDCQTDEFAEDNTLHSNIHLVNAALDLSDCPALTQPKELCRFLHQHVPNLKSCTVSAQGSVLVSFK